MLGHTHEIGGISAVIATDVLYKGIALSPSAALACLFLALVGALTPDLDKPTSLIYTKIPAGTLIGKIIHPIFIGGHRHISHSLLGFFIFAKLSHYLLFRFIHLPGINVQILWISYLIGILSHFILDAMTTEGIPFFFPFPVKLGIPPISALRIKTGSWVEHLIVFPLIAFSIIYMYVHFFSILNK